MRNHYPLRNFALLVCGLFITLGYSQTERQKQEIIKSYDLQKLNQLYQKFSSQEKEQKAKAYEEARRRGWDIKRQESNGTFAELQRFTGNVPIYYSVFGNDNAARSTRASFLHNGGGMGLNLEGQGMTAHVWDGGPTRTTHQDYSGRVTVGDGNTAYNIDANSDHATHVTGTIIGLGLGNSFLYGGSKGMAPQANAITHEWNDDLSEATLAAANGMILSNHSYGIPVDSLKDQYSWFIGAYTSDAQSWDELLFNSPYYLMVASSGNDGSNGGNQEPLGGNNAYDKLSGDKTAKNNLVVANANDANIAGDGSLNSVSRNASSSEGPTDDLRIKPEITGNGTTLYSASVNGDSSYNSKTGTSMSSPNVCGSLLLLQQHYSNTNGGLMKAATLKGLAMHTADDMEMNGPDANTGWGLMNSMAAANAITNNGLESWISEETLNQGETFTMTVASDGTSPLLASISWTDPTTGGFTNTTGTANDPTPALVNDLDIRITQAASTYYPWRLTSVNTNSNNGDNVVDPFERVDVNGASGVYTITVTHKGTLVNNKQNFSLVITGLSSSIALIKKTADGSVCSNNDATFNFDYKQVGGGTSNISANNVPTGATVNFTQNSFSADGNFDVTFGNLTAVPAGEHIIEVVADNGSETESRNIYLTVYHNTFTNIVQQSPADGSTGLGTTNILTWDADANSQEYVVEIATDPNFTNIVTTATVNTNQYQAGNLTQGLVYYWRILGQNQCATATDADPFNFQVGALACNTTTQTADTTILDQDTVTSTVNVTDMVTIGDINVRVDYDHTWIGDVALTLISPTGTRVLLLDTNTCSDQTDFHINFDDDSANTIDCIAANGAGLVTYIPVGSLLDFNGEAANGTWTLEITDGGPGDTGTVTEWALEICEATEFATAPNFVNNGFNVDLNSTYTAVTGDIEATSSSESAAQQTYTLLELPTLGNLRLNGGNLVIGDTFTQDDVNTSKITYVNTESSDYTDEFKVNIANAASGWLPNQIVPINAANLNISDFELGQLAIWPNPTKGQLNVQLNNASSSKFTISLYDLQGRTVFAKQFDNNNSVFDTSLDLSRFANGAYIVKIENGNKKATKQLIINN